MKKITAILLALILALGCCSALAENTKHERVWVVTSADGTVQSLTDTVRLENADGLDVLTDRTALKNIENAGGKESFTLEGDILTWQAAGADIAYQGTSDKIPAVLPVVTITLDGEEISAKELKEKTGEAVLTVTWRIPDQTLLPVLSLLPLPEEGVTDLKTENAAVLTEMGRRFLVGWALPGADESLNLPASFSVSFHADHADLSWMMTLSSPDPAEILGETLAGRLPENPRDSLTEITALLTALKEGTDLPRSESETGALSAEIKALNDGLTQLDAGALQLSGGAKDLSDGAASLKDGTAQVRDGAAALSTGADQLSAGLTTASQGAAALDTGLATLSASNETLNAGASQLFAAVLQTANASLASSGLSAAGIKVPELTAENYAAVLEAILAKLSPDIPALASARESLTALKTQLDQVNAFVTGLKTYTDGVSQASAGAAELNAGLTLLNTGAASLKDGAATLAAGTETLAAGSEALATGASELATGAETLETTGTAVMKDKILEAEKALAEKLLPLASGDLTRALDLLDQARNNDQTGYDLRPEDMKTVTVYIIRTDL